jgi:hypothetical protein
MNFTEGLSASPNQEIIQAAFCGEANSNPVIRLEYLQE